MKKFFIFASCFALALALSNVSVAYETTAVPCNCHVAVAPLATPPGCPCVQCPCMHRNMCSHIHHGMHHNMHPHMHHNTSARDIRRATRFEGRMNIRQMQVQQRLGTAPNFAGAPGAVGEMPAFTPGMYTPGGTVPTGFWSGPTVQTGRMNNSKQRVTANNVPVVNFMSVVRGGQRSH